MTLQLTLTRQHVVEHPEFTLALYRSSEQRDNKTRYQGIVKLKGAKRQ